MRRIEYDGADGMGCFDPRIHAWKSGTAL